MAQPLPKPRDDGNRVDVIANGGIGYCGFDAVLRNSRASPLFRSGEEQMNRRILDFQRILDGDTVILPVVFHIINEDPRVVPDQLIFDALNDLNNGFSRRGRYSASKGVDTRIRFCLARKDPDGGNTTGITRTKSFFTNHLNPLIEDSSLKNLVQWDPERYINIWYIKSMDLESFAIFSCGSWTRIFTSAYATMPPGGDVLDGIVLTSFGNVFIHEMGHYLGLYHIFEGMNCLNNDCTTDGDRVCDTPPDASIRSSSCDNPQNSCGTDTLSNHSNGNFIEDSPDQVVNFMDYGNPACQDQFTQGQADRMNAVIQTQRSGLLQNACDKPCNENISASFQRDKTYPLPGEMVSFTNASSGATAFHWQVNDVVAGNDAAFKYTFPAPGKYKVSLKAYSNDSCFATQSDFVIINCGVTARFHTNKRTIASKPPLYADSIVFTNNSENATSYRWMMSNDQGISEQVVSTSKDLVYVFPSPANYSVRLIATNGVCTDTTGTFQVSVSDPTPDGVPYMSTVDCYQQTKLRVSFFVCNYGFATIPANTPLTFYDADPRLGNARRIDSTFYLPDPVTGNCCGRTYTKILDVKRAGLDVLYLVFNDSGNTMPLQLPNTSLVESNYLNNTRVASNFNFKTSVLPPQSTLEPGDTLQLTAQAGPGIVSSYSWSTAYNLSCTDCRSPLLIADSDRVKTVIATSQYGCIDTAFTNIKVPPANDYTVELVDVQCATENRLHVNFSLRNNFKRGVIPAGLKLAFYDGDPATDTAKLLSPVFSVPDTVFQKQAGFSTFIQAFPSGSIYAMVNDDGAVLPVVLPGNNLLEKNYANNKTEFLYKPEAARILPQDATIFRKTSIILSTATNIYNPSSTTWLNGDGYTLSCNQCSSPRITVTDSAIVTMRTENRFGCLIEGKAAINVFPPDMTAKILETNCYSDSTTLVKFELCIGNNYDSLFAGIPVYFYEEGATPQTGNLLMPVFYTSSPMPGNCNTYHHIVRTPSAGNFIAVVNGQTPSGGTGGDRFFQETNYQNNTAPGNTIPFNVVITPADTSIERSGTLQLVPAVTGGTLSDYYWTEHPFLSCTACLQPVVTPLHTTEYKFVAQNQFYCVDTAYSIVKTTGKALVNIPSAFSPNNDGLNDRFYVIGGAGVNLKDLVIFNRWGEKVFESRNVPANDPLNGWDGTYKGIRAAAGSYVYVVRIEAPGGQEQVFKGSLVLVR